MHVRGAGIVDIHVVCMYVVLVIFIIYLNNHLLIDSTSLSISVTLSLIALTSSLRVASSFKVSLSDFCCSEYKIKQSNWLAKHTNKYFKNTFQGLRFWHFL